MTVGNQMNLGLVLCIRKSIFHAKLVKALSLTLYFDEASIEISLDVRKRFNYLLSHRAQLSPNDLVATLGVKQILQ